MDVHMVDDSILHMIGIVAGISILVGWSEQIYKGYKTKHLKDVSNYLMLFAGLGSTLWAMYGIFVYDVFIAGANLAAAGLVATVMVMRKKYAQNSARNAKTKASETATP